uniref:Aa_trans domain-containing protein n=1 Tax=Strongyloides venezuelensis TaxID=75913 RepID=A0A0K0FK65_STRVS
MDNKECFINFLKGMIGPGVLSLPTSFKDAGFIPAFIMIIVLGITNTYCMIQLVECSRYYTMKYKLKTIDYGVLAYYSSKEFMKSDTSLTKIFPTIVWTCLLLLQIGICSVFYVFVGTLSKELIENTAYISTKYDIRLYYIGYLIPFLILGSFKSIRTLTILNLFANILLGLSLLSIFLVLVLSKHSFSEIKYYTNINGFFTALGTIMYAFEGQALVIPLTNHMKESNSMINILIWGMTLIIIIAECSGVLGYLTYGNKVASNITLNLEDSKLLLFIKTIFMIVIFISYLIQMFVPIDMALPYVKMIIRKEYQNKNYLESILRIFFVILTGIISILIPNLKSIISIIGVTCGMILALVCPPIIRTFTFFTLTKSALKIIIIDSCIVLLGCIGIIFGLTSTIKDMML